MIFTNECIEAVRRYWQTTTDLNPDAGIITTITEYFENTPGAMPSKHEIEKMAFQILTTTKA